MCLFNLCSFVILVLIQSSLGNTIENAGSPILLKHAHQEFEHVNATLRTTDQTVEDDKICEAISLQRVLGVMMTMLRQDLSENSKTAYLLETLKDLLKSTARNNKEVTDKVDELLRTLDKYKEPVHEHSLRTETDKNSPLRILVRKPTKPNEKLQFRYELPNLSNSYCTKALVNIAKIAYQAYASLAENPICSLPGFPDYLTKDTPSSELSDQQSLDNPSLTNDPFQNILPAIPSNPDNPKFDSLNDFKNVLALYNPINLPNRPGEFIPDVHKVPYESNPLYPGDVDQAYNPFTPQSSDSSPSYLYPHKPKYILNRPKEIPNGLNDQEVPYESNPLYSDDVDQAYNPFYPQSQDTLPFDLYPYKQKHVPSRPEEIVPNVHDHKVPYESNQYPGDVNQAYNPFYPQSQDTLPFDLYPHKQKHIPNQPQEIIPNAHDHTVPYESNPYPGDVNQVYNPFSPQRPETLPYDLYSHKLHKHQPHSPFSEKPASNPLENFSLDVKPMLPENPLLFPWENPQSPVDFLKPDQDLINPENMAIDIPLNNPNAIDIPLNNPNAPNKYPLNHFGYQKTKNQFTPNYFLPQTRPDHETPELASLMKPYSPDNANLAEQGLELPYDKFRPLFNFEMNNPHNPSASDTGFNPDIYDIQLNPNKFELDVAPFKKPVNEYESKPFLNEDDDKPVQSPYDLIPKTPPEVIPQDNYITPSNLLEDKDLKVLVFIRDAMDVIEGVNPAIEFDSQTLYAIEEIQNLLDNEDTGLEKNDYRVIVELYKKIINYIKQLNGYDEIIDHIDLSRVTNSSKLENKKVELTYLVKRPKHVIYYPYYYVKYRLPYPSFVNAAQHLIKPKLLRTNPNQYEELLARSQVVETSPDLKHYKKHDLMGLIVQSGSLINAKLVRENLTLSDHLDALKDITSDLSAEELLKLNEDASSKLNLLAGNSGSVHLFEPINEQSNHFELQENNANSAIKPITPSPLILKTNKIQEIANSETELNSNIHHTTEPSADLTTFDSAKLRNTLLQSEDVGLQFSDHSYNENQLHNLYQPYQYQPSSNLPEREKMSPVMYKLLEETINTGLRGQNQQILNSQANINNLGSNQNTIYNGIHSSPENVKQTISQAGQSVMAQHSNGASTDEELSRLLKSIDDQYFQPSEYVNQGSDDYDYETRLKDQQSVGVNQDNIESSDGIMLQQITNQHSYYRNGLESLTQRNFSEPDTVFGQQNMSASNNLGPSQAIPNQQNPPLLTSNQHTPESNPNVSDPKPIPNQQNNAPWTNKESPEQGVTIQQNFPLENFANSIPPPESKTNSAQQNFETASYPSDQAFPRQQNYLPPGSPVNPQPESHQIWINPASGQQVIPSQQSSGHGTLSQQNIGIYSSSPDSQQAIAHQQNIYNTKDSTQTHGSQQNDLSTGSYSNLGQQQQAILGQLNPRTQEMWMNTESGQQIIPSQQSYGQGIGMYPSNPSAFQQAIVSQQNLYNTNNAMYGQQNYDIGLNAKRYVIPLPSIIYKRPIIQRYTPLVTQYSRPIVTNYVGY